MFLLKLYLFFYYGGFVFITEETFAGEGLAYPNICKTKMKTWPPLLEQKLATVMNTEQQQLCIRMAMALRQNEKNADMLWKKLQPVQKNK